MSGAACLEDESCTGVHELLRSAPSPIEDTGILETRHDREECRESTIPFGSATSARFTQSRQADIHDMRKIRMSLTAGAGYSISFTHEIAMRDALRSWLIWQACEKATVARYMFRTAIYALTCSANQ
jgi:hypothetical protein